ncbi:MAG TPA: hypothetical protein VFE80_10050, partial [Beijerinckiaceae bacterium]|nr:hypothetical protein [Beijerinckiaceae bacterium]
MSPARRIVSSTAARRNKCLTTLHKPCRERGPNDHEHCPRDQIRRSRRRRFAARAFEAFKDTNDSRLSRIETRLSGDVVTEEKLARIGDVLDEHTRRIDRVTLDARRPALAGAADARDPAVAEHKAAFDLYVRAGEAAGLKRLEAKAL